MASNQGHFVGSIPNDYAILARFAHDDHENQGEERNHIVEEEDENTNTNTSRLRRRSSLPPSHFLLPPPTMSSISFKSAGTEGKRVSIDSGATENTPLLEPLVPRIEEAEDEDDTKSNTSMFWEELRILSKYTLPVFGYVSILYLLPVN
jgi:MATE family multidrug resistance protein